MTKEQINSYYLPSFSGDRLGEGRSDFHHYRFIRNDKYGICLFLDDILQSSSHDQIIYHDRMTSFALEYVKRPKHVLIIGGAGGGILQQLFNYTEDSLSTVQIVDIDQKLFEIAPTFMKGWCKRELFNNRKVKIHYQNGADFIAKTRDKFDIIFLDVSDPLEITKSIDLYNGEVYKNIFKSLFESGIMVYHTAPLAPQVDIFRKYYKENITTIPSKFNSCDVLVKSFEDKWIFNVIQKMKV